jgi:hypothetical protein
MLPARGYSNDADRTLTVSGTFFPLSSADAKFILGEAIRALAMQLRTAT